jgi:hypothetical protein
MPIPTFHITISGSVVAAYAAVLSTLTATAQIVQFLRDRADVKIRVRRNMVTVGDLFRDGQKFTLVQVINSGRRPITITMVGAQRLYPLDPFVLADCNPQLPIELTEGKSLSAFMADAGIDYETIDAWEAYDTLGRSYKLPVASWNDRVVSRWRWRRSFGKKAKVRTHDGKADAGKTPQ